MPVAHLFRWGATVTVSILGAALFVASAHACTAGSPLITPSSANNTVSSGAPRVSNTITISFNCILNETYSVSTSAASFSATLSATPSISIYGAWYKDPALTQPLFNAPISATVSMATQALSITLYAALSGPSNGNFDGIGTYSFTMSGSVTPALSPINFALAETGTVNGTCSLNNASANFGNILTGSTPTIPISLSLNCTNSLGWTLTQSSVGTVTIGGNSSNGGYVFSDAGATLPLTTNSITGTGTGSSQTVSAYVGIRGTSVNNPINGSGAISGSIPLLVTF